MIDAETLIAQHTEQAMRTAFPVAVTDEESATKPGDQCTILARFATVGEAERWIGQHPDVDKVYRGGFGIDAPEGMAS